MAYNEFAYFYDEFNTEADYDALFTYICGELKANGITEGVVADLGCGTGDLTLMLCQAGYDMIGVDLSEDMLSILREKAYELGIGGELLLIHQNLLELELYGSLRAAVSTFDTFNHLGDLAAFEQAVARTAMFVEKGGVFIFDLNTPYKHREILGNEYFDFDEPDAACHWQNRYCEADGRVDITIRLHYKQENEYCEEHFSEYSYPLEAVLSVLERQGFAAARVADGEKFCPPEPDSQRWIITAVKK